MSLLKKPGIDINYYKNYQKSIYNSKKIDILLVILIFILVISPFILKSFSHFPVKNTQKELNLSINCIEYFGSEIMENLVQEFSNLNPNMKINFISDRLINDENDSITEPDILFFDEGDLGKFAAAGSLITLPDELILNLIKNNETIFNDIFVNQKFALPLVYYMDVLFYNIDILEKAGFDRPPKTREDFISYAKKISNAETSRNYDNNLQGIPHRQISYSMALNHTDKQAVSRDIFSWIWASGNDFWSGEELPEINNKAVIRDFDHIGRLVKEGILSSMCFNVSGDKLLDDFSQGKTAMIIASTKEIRSLKEKMGDNSFGITTIPGQDRGGKYSICLSGIYAGINVNCPYPEQALSFLELLPDKINIICEHLKAVPGELNDLYSGNNKSYVRDDVLYSKVWDIFESSLTVKGFSEMPKGENYTNIVWEELHDFINGTKTAEAIAANIQKRWDEEKGKSGE